MLQKNVQKFGMLMLIIQLSQNQLKKTNSKYLTGYLDKDIRPLVLIMPKGSGYAKTFKVEDEIPYKQ